MLLGIVLALAMQTAAPTFETVAVDAMSRVQAPEQAVARTETEWSALWSRHAGQKALPKINLQTHSVVAVFLGSRSSSGYSVEIMGTRQQNGALVVQWRERRPPADAMTAQIMTSPAAIALVPKFAGEIRFEKVEK
jgi:hypothetical protein